jgi:hypothetical protein
VCIHPPENNVSNTMISHRECNRSLSSVLV